jgi:hypothetical protein
MSTKDTDTGKILVALVNRPLTRRSLIRGALGVGVGFVGVGCFRSNSGNNNSGGMTSSNPRDGAVTETAGKGKEHLAAACGTYCGACPSYIAKHSEDASLQRPNPWGNCDGCLGGGQLAAHCARCSIRLCALNKQNVTRCCDCEELPCSRITNLIKDGGYPHRREYLPNLEKIREMGVQEWVVHEEECWRCLKCRLPMSWYDAKCARCGEPRSGSLFPVAKDTPRPY